MSNKEMKAGRFLRMQQARSLYRNIEHCFASGGQVLVATYTRSTLYRSLDWFKLGESTVYVRRGKQLDDIMGCAIRYGYPKSL